MQKKNLFNYGWVWHLLFWIVYIGGFVFIWGMKHNDYSRSLYSEMLDLPLKAFMVYTTLYILLPRYLFRQKYAHFILIFGSLMMVTSLGHRAMNYFFYYPIYLPKLAEEPFFNLLRLWYANLSILTVVAIAVAIKMFKRSLEHQVAMQELAKEKLEAELNFLKGQIHPHFLFNTLNSIYALSLKKSERTPEVVLQLSDLLNYMLYECNSAEVALEKEIKYVENYLALEKMRYGDRLNASISVLGETSGKKIAPMILLTFVENSFKHGVANHINKAWLTIDISVSDEGMLSIKVANSMAKRKPNAAPNRHPHSEGIGLANVRRRLALIYKDRYDLQVVEEPSSFSISLNVHLAKEAVKPTARLMKREEMPAVV